jgi:predicted NBD/HSP70 family sugar kinase
VSTATVSHVVNNSRRTTPETRARVEWAIAQTGFVPNEFGRLLALQKNNHHAPETPGPRAVERPATEGFAALSSSARVAPVHDRRPPFALAYHHEGAVEPVLNFANNSTARSLLKIVRAAQPISRADLARRLDVNRSTVTEIVKPLLAQGILREASPAQSGAGRTGRPPIGLSLRGEHTFFIGVSLGARRTQVGAATSDGLVLAEESFDTPAEHEEALRLIRLHIEKLRAALPDRSLSLIAVSVPGPTDPERTKLLYAAHLGWRDVEVAEALRLKEQSARRMTNYEIPVIVENDALAAATYEARRRLRDCADGTWNDFVLVRAGTGIGVGLVLGGEIFRGTRVGGGLAGEFGHMTIVAGGKLCVCGNRGCWERYASASSASSLYIGDRPVMGRTAPRFLEIAARAEAGERRAQATFENIGEHLGIGIGNVIGGVGIARVVVSGRVVGGWRFIEGPLKEALARTMAGRLAPWSVHPGEPTGAGLGGAIEVAVEQYLATLAVQIKAAA